MVIIGMQVHDRKLPYRLIIIVTSLLALEY